MVILHNGHQNEGLASIRYNMLCQKVARAKTFSTPERLPPNTCRFHSLRTNYQWSVVMKCIQLSGDGGYRRRKTLVMTDTIPAPEMLRQMIHCNCFEECNTQKCTCRKNGLECTSASGHCHDGQCDNMRN